MKLYKWYSSFFASAFTVYSMSYNILGVEIIDKSGAEIIAEAVEKCVEHGTDFLTVSDGVCLSGKCTVGLLGSSCSINSDCDLWDCP